MFPSQKMVQEFHEKYGCSVGLEPNTMSPMTRLVRVRLMTEELSEFVEACTRSDLLKMIDALTDLKYTVEGTAVAMGVDLEPFFREVHRSNMTKSLDRDSGGKIIKGPDFEPPDLQKILFLQMDEQPDWTGSAR